MLAGVAAVGVSLLGHRLRRVGRTLSQKQGEQGPSTGLSLCFLWPVCVCRWGSGALGLDRARGWARLESKAAKALLAPGVSEGPLGLQEPCPSLLSFHSPCMPMPYVTHPEPLCASAPQHAEELDRAQGQLQSASSRLSEAMEELESTR